jgi:uncharacterized protein (TIGR03382 family)
MALHATLADPRAPAEPPSRIEMRVAILPTPAGHVQLVAMSGQDATALAGQVQAFITDHLRLDGTEPPAPPAPPPSDAGAPDASAAANPAPPPRRREIDPNLPLWQPPPEELPRASTPASNASGKCGCTTPGAVPTGSSLALLGLAAVSAAVRRRRPAAPPR